MNSLNSNYNKENSIKYNIKRNKKDKYKNVGAKNIYNIIKK